MVNIKRQRIEGYVLLESLIATALFAFIVGMVLTEIQNSRQRQVAYLNEEESYQLTKMAIQTGQDQVSLNGKSVRVIQTDKGLTVYEKEAVLLEIQEN